MKHPSVKRSVHFWLALNIVAATSEHLQHRSDGAGRLVLGLVVFPFLFVLVGVTMEMIIAAVRERRD